MALIGVDIGGSGIKAVAFSHDGRILASEYREYPTINRFPGWFELDAKLIYRYIKELIQLTGKNCGEWVYGIGFSSLGECFVCLDENNNILSDCITYHDQRGQDLFGEFVERFPIEYTRTVLGGVTPSYVQAFHRLRVLQKQSPEILAGTKRICFLADFGAYMLGGEHLCDYSLATTTGCFDVTTLNWQKDFFQWAEIDPNIFPKPVPTGTCAGTMSDHIADEMGLNRGIKLTIGPNDQLASSIGADIRYQGDIFNAIGTADAMRTFSTIENAKRAHADYQMKYDMHYYKGIYTINPGPNYAGGSLLKWFRDNLSKKERELAELSGKGFYAYMDGLVPNEPTRLLAISTFSGTENNKRARGGILGLTLNTDNPTIYRALMEGETYTVKVRLESIREAGFPINIIKTLGGAARSDTFMQIRADIFNTPVAVFNYPEIGALGNALIAGVSAGIYSGVPEIVSQIVKVSKVFEPNRKYVDFYEEKYQKYVRIRKELDELDF